jgi:ribonuclease J
VGDVIEISAKGVEITGSIPCDPVFVDGSLVGTIDDVVLRDRQTLSGDGVVTIAATLDESGELIAGPEIVSRGFVFAQNSPELIEQVRERVTDLLRSYASNSSIDLPGLNRQIRNNISAYLQKQTGLRPMVLPVVLESGD